MLIPGDADERRVAQMTGYELLGGARGLANNLDLTGMKYTAAILRRLTEAMERTE